MFFLKTVLICVVMIGMVRCSGEHCCTSSQFEAKMKVETASLPHGSSTPTVDINTFLLEYDRDMKMEKITGTIYKDVGGVNETAHNYTVVNDYGNGKSYNFGVYAGTKYCEITQTDPKDMMKGCIPSSYNFTGSFTLGSGSNSVQINSFDGIEDNMHWSMQATVHECTPVAYSGYGMKKDGSNVRTSGYFVDFVQNATFSAGTFALPDSCKKTGN
ncbi:uncharacterized protein LOC123528486 [Mercenaria mercenaria]|uniref:uncharacterized protein LOC123528486 n=1 Tax=Mercenaria mercenaria TaxID=6596 RepID=UPI00234F5D03|nr:uncharacterized protein LOC123528486 [Mercenaria mercenaria]